VAQSRVELLGREDRETAVPKIIRISGHHSVDGFKPTGLYQNGIFQILEGRFNRRRENLPVHGRDLKKTKQVTDRRTGRLSA